jgi:mannosyl-oligosaccharide alpha-1,2-mannosidase
MEMEKVCITSIPPFMLEIYLTTPRAATGEKQEASDGTLIAELGSLCLEFTRLSQLTGIPKFYDATQRVTNLLEKHQSLTQMPGMWPIVVDAKNEDFTRYTDFTLGAMADSTYEYLPKVSLLIPHY